MTGLKPGKVTFTVYWPGATPLKVKLPSACVCATLFWPPPVSTTGAAGMIAPESSFNNTFDGSRGGLRHCAGDSQREAKKKKTKIP